MLLKCHFKGVFTYIGNGKLLAIGLQERTGLLEDTWRARFWMSTEHWKITSNCLRLDFTPLDIHQHYKMASLKGVNLSLYHVAK